MNIHFKIRKQGKLNPKIIMHVFDGRFEGRKFMYSTGQTIPDDHWDKRKNRAKFVKAHASEYEALNKYLDKLEQTVISFKSERHNSSSLRRQDLKNYLLKSQDNEPTNEGGETLDLKTNSSPDSYPTKVERYFQIKIWTKTGNILQGEQDTYYNLNGTLTSLALLAKNGIVPRMGDAIHFDDADLESWTAKQKKLFIKQHHINPESPMRVNEVHFKPTKGGTDIKIILVVSGLE